MGTDDPRPTPVVMSWSGGKDSAIALHELQVNPRYILPGVSMTSGCWLTCRPGSIRAANMGSFIRSSMTGRVFAGPSG
jgi:hypothetical protein